MVPACDSVASDKTKRVAFPISVHKTDEICPIPGLQLTGHDLGHLVGHPRNVKHRLGRPRLLRNAARRAEEHARGPHQNPKLRH